MAWNKRTTKKFDNLDEAIVVAREVKNRTTERDVNLEALTPARIDGTNTFVLDDATTGKRLHLNNWAYQQYCQAVDCPPHYLGKVSAECAVVNLSEGKSRVKAEGGGTCKNVKLYTITGNDGKETIRSMNSPKYGRYYDLNVLLQAKRLESMGWGFKEASMSDRFMTASLIDTEGPVIHEMDDKSDQGLRRAINLGNSEVGFRKYYGESLFSRLACDNGMRVLVSMWEVNERHIGNAQERIDESFEQFVAQLRDAPPAHFAPDEIVRKAMRHTFGDNRKETVEALYRSNLRSRTPVLTKRVIRAAWDSCVKHERWINPNSHYGIVQGITRESQNCPHYEDRVALDNAAGKILELSATNDVSEADLAKFDAHPSQDWAVE